MVFIAVLEIGASFVQTFQQFLAVRALFGIGMGGIWGMAASTSLEAIPVEARGLGSGILQQGYAVGYLIAAVINLLLVPEVEQGWRSLFWVAGGISFFAATLRLMLPESQVFLKAKAEKELLEKTHPDAFKENKTKVFFRETGKMLKDHWLLCIYGVLLMTGTFSSSTNLCGGLM
jgi:MFS transporter, SHS family, lactate transporter